jgi:hypothetical protein
MITLYTFGPYFGLPDASPLVIKAMLLLKFAGLAYSEDRGGYTKNACGKENQRPCIIIERIPSCDPNLKESGGSCIHPDCGRKDQRPCVVTERIPSCDNDLIEYGGICYGRMECGALNRRPCTIAERVPSCDGDLVEMTGGKCVSLNRKPLKLTVVNDCDKKMESILLYDQKDLMAKTHALNILAVHYW